MFFYSWESNKCFSQNVYILTIEKLSFILAHVSMLGSMEYGNTWNDCFYDNELKNSLKLKKDHA